MAWLAFLYGLTVLFTGGPLILHGSVGAGLTGIFAPLIALIAGGGITTALVHRSGIGSVIFGFLLLGGTLYWMGNAGWSVWLFGLHIGGATECLVGFVIGALFGLTDRRSPTATDPTMPAMGDADA